MHEQALYLIPIFDIKIAVNPCRTPDLVNNPHSKEKETRLVGVTGAIDRPENPPLPAGDYLNFGTFLKVKITLKYPLSCSAMLSPDCSMLKDKVVDLVLTVFHSLYYSCIYILFHITIYLKNIALLPDLN